MNIAKRSIAIMTMCSVFMLTATAYSKEKTANFSDVYETSGYAEEVTVLTDSGIIQGNDNGNFRPQDEITRAEFAAVLCRAMGVEDEAKTVDMKTQNYFTDVPSEHWASGYINAAYDFGAINGVGSELFMPESPVTNEQVIKMLVASWGYALEAESLGGYPDGYMEIAHRYGVLDAISFNYGNASKRWVVSLFVYGVIEKLPVSESAEKKPAPPISPQGNPNVEKKEPLSEYNGKLPDDPISILKRVTAQSAKYEETAFIFMSTEISSLPFSIVENSFFVNR